MKHCAAIIKTLTAFVIGITAVSVQATPIQGSATVGYFTVSLKYGEVDWNSPLNPGMDLNRTYGAFATGPGNTGSFATGAMTGITGGVVQDMSETPGDANFTPVGPGSTPNFIQFYAQPGWLFVMDFLAPSASIGTPFNFTNVGPDVLAQLAVSGWACDTGGDGLCDLTDDRSTWTGNFSTNYYRTSAAELEAQLLAGAMLPANTWSGEIVATAVDPAQVPVPSTLALFGLALAGLGMARRHKV